MNKRRSGTLSLVETGEGDVGISADDFNIDWGDRVRVTEVFDGDIVLGKDEIYAMTILLERISSNNSDNHRQDAYLALKLLKRGEE